MLGIYICLIGETYFTIYQGIIQQKNWSVFISLYQDIYCLAMHIFLCQSSAIKS